MQIFTTKDIDKKSLLDSFITNWGSPQMVISSGTYNCSELDGFVMLDDEMKIMGLITYYILKNECEIISLDSMEENKGIGTKLLEKVEVMAKTVECNKVKLVTTNDNLRALKFYQKRDYVLSNIYYNAVLAARKIKAEIPLIGDHGIPIRDEIELMKLI